MRSISSKQASHLRNLSHKIKKPIFEHWFACSGNTISLVDLSLFPEVIDLELISEAELAWMLEKHLRRSNRDQLLVHTPIKKGLPTITRIFNRDGSEAKQCLNGMRALAQIICEENGIIQNPAGDLLAVVVRLNGQWGIFSDNIANEHSVYILEEPQVDPTRNVEWVHQVKPQVGMAKVRVWERGVGETGSCGSGAVATAEALWRKYQVQNSRWELRFPGGRLVVEKSENPRGFFLTGDVSRTSIK